MRSRSGSTLLIRHGHADDPGDVAAGTASLRVNAGELIALVDVGSSLGGVRVDVADGHTITMLDERTGGPRRGQLRPLGGRTTVLVTRDARGLLDVVDRVALVYAGHVIESGAAERIVTNPRHPLTRRLLRGGRPPEHLVGTHVGCPYVAHCPLGDLVCEGHVPELRDVADRRVACHYAELGPGAWTASTDGQAVSVGAT